MAEPMLCPSCQKPLRVPADFHLAWLTCQHCRALVPTPAAEPDPQPPVTNPPREVPGSGGSDSGVGAPLPRPRARDAFGGGRTCSHCGKPAEPEWLFCPHCEEPLRSTTSPRPPGRDWFNPQRAGSNPVWAVLGSFGLIFALLATGGAFAQGSPQPFLLLVGCVFAVVGISALVTLVRSDGALSSRNLGKILLGALSLAGMLIASGGLLVLAGIVFAFVVCLAGGRGC